MQKYVKGMACEISSQHAEIKGMACEISSQHAEIKPTKRSTSLTT